MGLGFIPLGVGDAFSRAALLVLRRGRERRALAARRLPAPHPQDDARGRGGLGRRPRRGSLRRGRAHSRPRGPRLRPRGARVLLATSSSCRRVRLVTHPTVLAGLWDGRLAGGMSVLAEATHLGAQRGWGLGDYFDAEPLDEEGAVKVGPFDDRVPPTRHLVPTTALRIRAGGKTLGLSSDTAFDPPLIAWLAEADLVLHETGLGIHTPYETLVVAPAGGAREAPADPLPGRARARVEPHRGGRAGPPLRGAVGDPSPPRRAGNGARRDPGRHAVGPGACLLELRGEAEERRLVAEAADHLNADRHPSARVQRHAHGGLTGPG